MRIIFCCVIRIPWHSLADSIDEIISTCFEMGEQGWENCAQYYSGDTYADWRHISQPDTTERKEEKELQGKEQCNGHRCCCLSEFCDTSKGKKVCKVEKIRGVRATLGNC